MVCIFDEYFEGRTQSCIADKPLDCKTCPIHNLVEMAVAKICRVDGKERE